MKWKKVKCHECGDKIIEDDACYDSDTSDPLCDECHYKLHELCPICDEYFKRPETFKDKRFFVNAEMAKDCGVKMGVYQAMEPYYYDNETYLSNDLYFKKIKLIKKFAPGEVIECHDRYGGILKINTNDIDGTGFICPNCWNHIIKGAKNQLGYTGKKVNHFQDTTKKVKNLKEAEQLCALYESMTEEKVREILKGHGYKRVAITSLSKILLTGFGSAKHCILCGYNDKSIICDPECFYLETTGHRCCRGINEKTYKGIEYSHTIPDYLAACKARAAHLRTLIGRAKNEN